MKVSKQIVKVFRVSWWSLRTTPHVQTGAGRSSSGSGSCGVAEVPGQQHISCPAAVEQEAGGSDDLKVGRDFVLGKSVCIVLLLKLGLLFLPLFAPPPPSPGPSLVMSLKLQHGSIQRRRRCDGCNFLALFIRRVRTLSCHCRRILPSRQFIQKFARGRVWSFTPGGDIRGFSPPCWPEEKKLRLRRLKCCLTNLPKHWRKKNKNKNAEVFKKAERGNEQPNN